VAVAAPAAAQTPTRAFGWELSGGVSWVRGLSLGTTDGLETQPDGTPFTLFTSTTSLDNAVGAHLALARHLVGPLSLEAEGGLEHSVYRVQTTSDFEGAANVSATNTARTYTITGSLVATFARHARLQPFLRLGIGGRRELSEDQTLLATGRLVVAGGGIKYWIGGPTTGRFGLRVEADAVGRSGGLLLGDATRFAPSVRAGCSLRF
jgi:hypothetical protein